MLILYLCQISAKVFAYFYGILYVVLTVVLTDFRIAAVSALTAKTLSPSRRLTRSLLVAVNFLSFIFAEDDSLSWNIWRIRKQKKSLDSRQTELFLLRNSMLDKLLCEYIFILISLKNSVIIVLSKIFYYITQKYVKKIQFILKPFRNVS